MRTLSEQELFGVWEAGFDRGPAERALGILRAAGAADPARLPVGRRDALLLDMRERLFGSGLAAAVVCPGCGEEQEFELQAAAIRAPQALAPVALSIVHGEYMVEFRLPDTTDVLAIAVDDSGEHALANAKRALLERCVLGATRDQRAVAARELPSKVVDIISNRMAEADPQADTELSLECAACQRVWTRIVRHRPVSVGGDSCVGDSHAAGCASARGCVQDGTRPTRCRWAPGGAPTISS